jgi:hypothetical protein
MILAEVGTAKSVPDLQKTVVRKGENCDVVLAAQNAIKAIEDREKAGK